MLKYDNNYLLNKKVKIYQPQGLYHASTDAVWLAAAVNKVKKGDRFLDVGAGTGAVSLCLAHRFIDKNITVTGVDIQAELVAAAKQSAQDNGFNFARFEQVDILKNKYLPCSFNHVISNPPYYESDMPSPNSSKATAHNLSMQNFAKWIDFCIKALKPQGRFYMINRAEMLEDIITLLHGRLGAIEVFPIFSKPHDKQAKRVIVRAQKDNKTPLKIYNPLYVHNDDGSHSIVAEKVLRQGDTFE